MTPQKEVILNFTETNSGKVRMANNTSAEVKGIGSVRFENPDGTTFVLHEVRYMPSIGRKVVKGCTVIMKGVRKGRDTLYVLQGITKVSGSCNVVSTGVEGLVERNYTHLWHSRLGHVGQKAMDVLAQKGCLEKEKLSDIDFCKDCVIGKTHKVSFGQAKHITKNKLDYIHSDLWGSPNVPPNLSKSQYFVSFTDDWFRKV